MNTGICSSLEAIHLQRKASATTNNSISSYSTCLKCRKLSVGHQDVAQLRKDFEELKLDIEDILHDQNDINESTRMQLEAIDTAIAELQAEHRKHPKRKPIGFIQPKDDEEDTK